MHTNFRQNQLVFVHLKNGEKFVDKFFENNSKHVVLVTRGRIVKADIRAISIYRPRKKAQYRKPK